ncbi:nucleotidyltransferase (plasmid) [Sinorhizobium meliloti]|uniref:nucleotidyltransferase and HEPN domain-containing protein n=1 Tax=Rhizobium meliloti TaxID=382 RepID=UPI000B4A3145|nr:nucleotidyltransferase and HEPN domain-containing protein [Sinorhizobium meliloti]ASP88615.1 nucleotidyltransferase [Sinorhizobium meliloti]MQW31065.1 HEPN domain-containing protein [Sinorhizobium meliloti]MQW60879.1 HEPN domain-containing protein [Sinorhizobium meliloti]MQX93257.1 HEPN domain-containing protein [Sinorhizobium meliloti]
MRSSLEHLPERKQRELARVVEIIHEEFADALEGSSAAFKKRGRILKIILFGSYARGTWVDEPHTMKGYRSDYDILVIVSSKKLAEPQYWDKASDRLMWDKGVSTPVGLIAHGAREVNNFLADGQYFFVDILREGILLYELDERPLAEPQPLSPADALRVAREHFERQCASAIYFCRLARYAISDEQLNHVAFNLHQAVETAYSCVLLTLTNYSPPSHNVKFLRGLAEDHDLRLIAAWPRDQHRFTAWYNILNEAYVKARYSKHFEITGEALRWLLERTEHLLRLVEMICTERLGEFERATIRDQEL